MDFLSLSILTVGSLFLMYLLGYRSCMSDQARVSEREAWTEGRRQAYLDEMAFRYNNRRNPYPFRDTLLKLIGSENPPYRELTA